MKTKKHLITIFEYELPIEVKEEERGFVARCSRWSDCYAQGDSLEETINEISSVAASLIELYKEEKLKIPLRLKRVQEKSEPLLRFNFPLIVSS